jgi:hypothetical protein
MAVKLATMAVGGLRHATARCDRAEDKQGEGEGANCHLAVSGARHMS